MNSTRTLSGIALLALTLNLSTHAACPQGKSSCPASACVAAAGKNARRSCGSCTPACPDPDQAIAATTVTRPPASLKLDPIYTKYVDVDGLPIVATDKTDDHALLEAAWIIRHMLVNRPDIIKTLARRGARMVVWAHNEYTTDLPEWADHQPKDYWDRRARGLGGKVFSCGEENLLGLQGDPYHEESILVHEFAHNIHLQAMAYLDPTFNDRLKKIYQQALRKGLWKDTYASTAFTEYFAEAVQSFFNTNRQPDHDHNFVDTREELKQYDPDLYRFCLEVFGPVEWVYTKPQNRLAGHLADFDPDKAPRFQWPEHLAKIGKKIRDQEVAKRREKLAQRGLYPGQPGPAGPNEPAGRKDRPGPTGRHAPHGNDEKS